MIDFFVPGRPKAKGSLVVGVRKDGSRFTRTQTGYGQAQWAAAVKLAAVEAMRQAGMPIQPGPLRAEITFVRTRPKAHLDTKGRVRERHLWDLPTARPDLDKVMRSVGDALQGAVYKDDAQITECTTRKRWGEVEGVRIQIMNDIDTSIEGWALRTA